MNLLHIRQIPLWPTNPVDFDSYPISLVLAWGKKIRFLAYKIIFYAPVESSGSQETLLGTGFWLDDKEKWTTNEWLFKCRYIFGAWCVARFVFHVSLNFDSTRILDLFVLYFSISGKMKKILMKPWVPSVGNLEIVLLILISHTLCMHCDRIRD